MITARLVVTQVLGLWHVSGAILTDDLEQPWTPIAGFSEDVILSDHWLDEDPTATVLEVIRQWSERTIQR